MDGRTLGAIALVPCVVWLSACGSLDVEPTPNASALTRGPLPDSARGEDGSIVLSEVPDFIPATSGDDTAGWVASSDLFGPDRPEIITVFADDLVTVVGHMYPEVGFVPLGAEAEMLPDPSRNRSLTILVRNESDRAAILEITEARDQVSGQPRLLAPPIVVEAGAEQEVHFQAPQDRWSLNLRGDLGFFFSDDLGRWSRSPGFSLVVGADGVLKRDR